MDILEYLLARCLGADLARGPSPPKTERESGLETRDFNASGERQQDDNLTVIRDDGAEAKFDAKRASGFVHQTEIVLASM